MRGVLYKYEFVKKNRHGRIAGDSASSHACLIGGMFPGKRMNMNQKGHNQIARCDGRRDNAPGPVERKFI